MTEHPPSDLKTVTLRMPRDLHRRVADGALADHRSVNTQLVLLIAEALDARDREQAAR